jgi:type II restriction/modification system DNA methylase subunit YeeA
MDPSIFGTLFERVMDPAQRSQLGAHYTSYADVATLIEPVVISPLHEEWNQLRGRIASLVPDVIETGDDGSRFQAAPDSSIKEAQQLVDSFLDRLRSIRILDPACGSGNFLYVTMRRLKDLEKDVLVESRHRGLKEFDLAVGPHQLHGIEKNPYAFDLAQMTIWIGYLQWQRDNGFPINHEPILRSLHNFELKDAILDLTDPNNPSEPDWPGADFIVGNPPFLGGKKMRTELGDEYVDRLFQLWRDRVRPEADLCCYWFEKARQQITVGKCKRAGLLATQGIRGGASRESLKRIKQTGDLFFAESDRPWVLDGANVHVSMIGFDGGLERVKVFDGQPAASINSNLTSLSDVTQARRLLANLNIAFMGVTKGGGFDVVERQAIALIDAPNPHGRPSSDVIVPWINGLDVTRRKRNMWIIDFGVNRTIADAASYERTFEYVRENVEPDRKKNKRQAYRERWWIHVEARPAMRDRLASLPRFVVTARVAKYRLFVWIESPTLPDCQVFAFARSDDYFFGVLQSRVHEVWGLKLGTRLETRPRYTPTTCFETFPFPEPTDSQRKAIAQKAKRLDELRSHWLNPPEWTRQEILEFPGAVDGPWGRYVHDPNAQGIGTVRYPRSIPKDAHVYDLAKRTLTNLYNERPTWLDLAHKALDEAVFAAYGWDPPMTDEEILAALLELNLERSESIDAVPSAAEADETGEGEPE